MITNRPEFTESMPLEGQRAQCNLKIDAKVYWQFKKNLHKQDKSVRQVLEQMMEIYSAQAEGRAALHMDGSECPLSALITGLRQQVEGMLHR